MNSTNKSPDLIELSSTGEPNRKRIKKTNFR